MVTMAIFMRDSLPSRSKMRTLRGESRHSAAQVRSHLAEFARPLGMAPPQEKRKTHASAATAIFIFTSLDVAEAAPAAEVKREFRYKCSRSASCIAKY